LDSLKIKASKVFNTIYASKKKIVIARGGTRAGKTYAIMQMLALWLITGVLRGKETKATTASVVRKTLPSLKATAMRDLEEILQAWGLYNKIEINKTDKIYSYGGRIIEFFSVDDQQKVRGRKRDILFCNEANELTWENDFFQLNMRTSEFIIIDLNPSDPYTWIKTELEDKAEIEGNIETFIFTYKDNGFLTAEQCRTIESIKDETLRQVYVHGQYGIVKGLVFPDIVLIDSFPVDCEKVAIGLDFGYTNDPTAALMCGTKGDNLYIDELIYEHALTNDLIAKKLPKNLEVFADAAEPKSIAELKKYGIRAIAAQKGRDSIQFGINTLKRYKLHITARSFNLLKEQKLYKYKVDNVGNPLNEPIDHFNHAWDAVRYYALTKLDRPDQRVLSQSKRK